MKEETKISYHANGSIKRITPYINGLREGTVKQFYQTGIIETEVDYRSGKISGKVKTYYSDGDLESVESYSEGVRNNDLVVYDRYGRKAYAHNTEYISTELCRHLHF